MHTTSLTSFVWADVTEAMQRLWFAKRWLSSSSPTLTNVVSKRKRRCMGTRTFEQRQLKRPAIEVESSSPLTVEPNLPIRELLMNTPADKQQRLRDLRENVLRAARELGEFHKNNTNNLEGFSSEQILSLGVASAINSAPKLPAVHLGDMIMVEEQSGRVETLAESTIRSHNSNIWPTVKSELCRGMVFASTTKGPFLHAHKPAIQKVGAMLGIPPDEAMLNWSDLMTQREKLEKSSRMRFFKVTLIPHHHTVHTHTATHTHTHAHTHTHTQETQKSQDHQIGAIFSARRCLWCSCSCCLWCYTHILTYQSQIHKVT